MANPENWRVKDDVRRLTYNLMRCPAELMDLLGQMYEHTKPEIAGLILRMDSMFPSTVCFFVKVLWHKICDSRVPCQLCASKTWMVTTTSPVQNLMVPKASGKKCRLLGYNYKWSWLQHVFKPCQISFNFSQLYSVLKMVSICVVQSFLTDIIVFSKWF